jgi:hypothetical protein
MADEKPQLTASLADDERALHKGRGKMGVAIAVFAIALVGAGVWYVMTASQGEEVRTTLGNVNRLNREHYKSFWGCALQSPMERYTKAGAAELIVKLSKMVTGSEKRYAAYIRTKCMPNLAPYRANLDALPQPAAELQAEVAAIGGRIDTVRSSWTDFIAYLESTDVDPETTPERVQIVAKGWYDYQKTFREFQDKGNKVLGTDLATQ